MCKCLFRLLSLLLLAAMFLCSAAAQVYIGAEKPEGWDDRALLRVTFFPEAQNDAILLECGGQTMLVDGGEILWTNAMAEALARRGIDHLDYMFNSHPHDDHIEVQYYLLKRGLVTPDVFISPFLPTMNVEKQQLMVALL